MNTILSAFAQAPVLLKSSPTSLRRCILYALPATAMANLPTSEAGVTSVVSWEYSETTKCGHKGWVTMDKDFSKWLEEMYTNDPNAVLRYQDEGDCTLHWKFDLRAKTQRRRRNDQDQCTRDIRRIYLIKDAVDAEKESE